MIPTHRCTTCFALWCLLKPTAFLDDSSWSLVSKHCGPCCDNVAMADQIVALSQLVEQPIQARDAEYGSIIRRGDGCIVILTSNIHGNDTRMSCAVIDGDGRRLIGNPTIPGGEWVDIIDADFFLGDRCIGRTYDSQETPRQALDSLQ